ncbi:hypothetical protein BC832DRAFT_595820 [Gaertneriomyces semiglobifer]|nr:hypothetical protein BC832DRAFT_595820 [Gaertneriomyces semiglobifer]
MGRVKDRRVKGSAQPADSSRAADLLASTAFGAFGSQATTVQFTTPAFGSGVEWELGDIHGEVKVLFKRLSKRDSVTRTKALEELSVYVQNEDVESVKQIVPAWVKTYIRLNTDANRRVRELTNIVHLLIVKKDRKQLAPYLKEVIGYWLCAKFDTSKESSKAAVEAFDTAFPKKKADVLVFCQTEILAFITENILHQTPETLSDPRFTTDEDSASKYARIVSSSFYMLGYMLEQVPETEVQQSRHLYESLCCETKFWSKCRHESAQIRCSVYYFLKTAVQKVSNLLEPHIQIISTTFLGKAFTDTEQSTHRELWDALVLLTKEFPHSWILASEKKPVLPKLYAFLKKGVYGSVSLVYPSLLALIAHLPKEILYDCDFRREFLSSIWAGLESGTLDQAHGGIFLESYLECVMFLIVSGRDNDELASSTRCIVNVDFFRPINAYLFPSRHSKSTGRMKPADIARISAKYFVKLGTSSKVSRQLFDAATEKLMGVANQALTEVKYDEQGVLSVADFDLFCKRLAELFGFLQVSNPEIEEDFNTVIRAAFASALMGVTENEHRAGLSLFLRDTARRFISLLSADADIRQSLKNFITERLTGILKRKAGGDVSYLPEMAVRFLHAISTSESDESLQLWSVVVEAMFGVASEALATTLTNVIHEVAATELHRQMNLQNDRLDQWIRTRVCRDFADDAADSVVTDLVSSCLSFDHQHQILSAETTTAIVEHLAEAMANFAEQLTVESKDLHGHVTSNRISILSAQIKIILDILRNKEARGAFVAFNGESMVSIAWAALQIAQCRSLHEEDTVIKSQCAAVWSAVTSTCAETIVDSDNIANRLSVRWNEAFENPNYCATAHDFVMLLQKISDICQRDETKKAVLEGAVVAPQEDIDWWYQPSSEMLQMVDRSAAVVSTLRKTSIKDGTEMTAIKMYTRKIEFLYSMGEAFGVSEVLCGTPVKCAGIVELLRWVDAREIAAVNSVPLPLAVHVEPAKIVSLVDAAVEHSSRTSSGEWHQIAVRLCRELMNGGAGAPEEHVVSHGLLLAAVRATLENPSAYTRVLRTILRKFMSAVGLVENDARLWLSLAADLAGNASVLGVNLALLDTIVLERCPAEELRNKVVAIINRISELDRENALRAQQPRTIALLSMLNMIVIPPSGFPDDSYFPTILGTTKVIELVRCFRTWYERDGSIQYDPSQRSLDVQVSLFLHDVVRNNVDIGINLCTFVTQLCQKWMLLIDIEPVANRTLIYRALKLYAALDEEQDMYSGMSDALSTSYYEVNTRILDLFLLEADRGEILPEPEYVLQETLAELASRTPEKILFEERPFDRLCSLLYMPNQAVQKCAFGLLRRITAEHVQSTSLAVEMNVARAGSDTPPQEPDTLQLPAAIITAISTHIPDIEDFAENETISGRVFGYLLSWMALFDHLEDCTFDLKTQYIAHIRNGNILPKLLENLFSLLGVGWSRTPFDPSKFEIDHYEIEGFEITLPLSFSLLASHLYWRALRHLPSLVRIWWSECKNRQLTIAVESYTEKFFSPILIQGEVSAIQNMDKSTFKDLTVKASKSGNEVSAAYTIEDATLELVIRLPSTFPLTQVTVESGSSGGGTSAGGRAAGISESKWRAWLLSTTAVIVGQNGSILDAIRIYGRNLALHFEGVEDCAICYSIIGVIDRTLPTKQCKTCKHLFHSACLFKWFKTSNQSTCPLCRQSTF